MPNPRPGESRDDFLDRCIPEVIGEGREPDQAVAMCIAYYEGEKDKAFNIAKDDHIEYWKAFDRRREGFLPKYTRIFTNAIKEQLEPFRESYTFADLRKTINPAPVERAFKELYEEVGDTFARATWSGLKKMPYMEMKQEPTWFERMLWYVLRSNERIIGINAYTQEQINRIILFALEEGLSIQETVDLIVGTTELEPLNGNLFARARRIARTEIISASNAGSFEGARSSGLKLRKQWVATPDSRTRGADGESDWNHYQYIQTPFIVEMDQTFNMTSRKGETDSLLFPGDPSGKPGNVINCRCTQIYITPES